MRSKPLLFLAIALPLLIGGGVTWLAATASFKFEWQGRELDVTRNGRLLLMVAAPIEQETASDPDSAELGIPKAEVPTNSHDFGTMDPLTMGQHKFMIKNTGTAPLKLKQGPTTCKCTLSNLARNFVMPGEEAIVTLNWNTGRDQFYSHEATIFTSDPEQSSVALRVHGNVRTSLGIRPESLQFPNLRPDKPSTAEVLVYTQVWDEFELVSGKSTDERITWELEDANDNDLTDAKAAKLLRVTVPAGMPSGILSERIQFIARPVGGDKTTIDVAINGKIPRRLAVLGPSIGSDGIIDLGQVYVGESRKKRLLLKVRDDDLDLVATRIKCEPDFVSVNVLPYEGNSQSVGLSTLEIELPLDAPACSFLGVPMGSLHIDFDHPRIRNLDLKLKFAVLEKS